MSRKAHRHDEDEDRHLRWLLERLPARLRRPVEWLRRPSSRWLRLPCGALLIVGGVFSFLPVLGLWMLPLGVLLLGEDIPALKRATNRSFDWAEQRWSRRQARRKRRDHA
jgi:hypothetical protein